MSSYRHILFIIAICLLCCSCVPRGIRKAQCVVAQADSLWHEGKMYGVDMGDSATLAQAYETLGAISFPFREGMGLGSTYAHSCYHYGRLLRAKDNPVEAMQVFIEATHSRTRDYHILGRVYSNMGDICHLAGEYPLSYDMYQRSADMYLRNGDTLLYYYDLNNMAFEAAEMADTCACLPLLRQITCDSIAPDVQTFVVMTHAKLSLKCKQYDSAIYYARRIGGSPIPLVSLILAQSYSYLGVKDSAIYYAKQVLTDSKSLYDINNALYILTNDDDMRDKASIRKMAAVRADIQKQLKINQGHLSQAVQLLEQDINRKPDLRWLMAIIGTLLAIGGIIGFYVYQKRKKQALLAQKIEVLEKTANTIQEKKDELVERYQTNHKQIEDEINSRCSMLKTNESIKKNLAWKNYKKMCRIVDQRFYFLASKLRNNHFLDETEVRLCILTLLDCEYDRIAELLWHAPTSIGTLKMRVAEKLGTTAKNLRRYLIDNECVS